MSINKVILVGNLGTSPELHTSENKKAVCNFSVATNHLFKESEKQERPRTEWHQVICFGNTAESCAQYLSKGRQVYVEGRIQSQKWQDKDGKDRFTHRIVANTVQFLGVRQAKASKEALAEVATEELLISEGLEDEDIPF